MVSYRVVITFALATLIAACSIDPVTPMKNDKEFGLVYPTYFPAPHYFFENNALSKAGFELGRKLFYEKLLSKDNSISCGSCHAQVHAFADHNSAFSFGINQQISKRNSPAMMNLAWHTSFMWDGGINHIEVMPVDPITNPIEMDETFPNLIAKLQNTAVYPPMFKKAFGNEEITDQRILLALAQFMGMMVSAGAKYDHYRQGKSSFTSNEMAGLQLFRQHCESCHREPLFTDFSFSNNGLDFVATDEGRAGITMQAEDHGKFKVPTLRNIALTHPYMHDGRFGSLIEVVQHYASHVKPATNLDSRVPAGGIGLSQMEMLQIIDFLQTLTDYNYISDHRFSDPNP